MNNENGGLCRFVAHEGDEPQSASDPSKFTNWFMFMKTQGASKWGGMKSIAEITCK